MANGHRIFAGVYERAARREGQAEQKVRAEVAGGARGATLELGYGVGGNWPFVPQDARYTGLEPDAFMRMREAFPRPPGSSLLAADAQRLPFADDSFDTVLATLVFCTIPNPSRALAEVRRVLRPGGELRFWEHVRSAGRAARILQDAVTPAWKFFAGGCHPNRDTLAAIVRAGFEIETVRDMKLGPLPAIVGSAKPAPEAPATTERQ